MKNIFQILCLVAAFVFIVVTSAFGRLPTPEEQEIQCSHYEIDYKKAVIFAKAIQDAVRNNDKKTLAELVGYPLSVAKYKPYQVKNGDVFYIKTKKEFIKNYNLIFTKELVSSVLEADPNDIFCNYEGGGIAGGTIWFHGSENLSIDTVIR